MTFAYNNTKSKSSLFLLELIIAIVFFALSSAICVQLFVKAHMLSKQSADLNMALIQAQNVAETFKATGGDGLSQILAGAPSSETAGDNYIFDLYYDENWQKIDLSENAAYNVNVTISNDSGLETADIAVNGKETAGGDFSKNIYSLTAKVYSQTEVDAK